MLAVLLDPKAEILQSLPGLGIHNSVIIQNPLNLSLLFPVDALIVIFLDQVGKNFASSAWLGNSTVQVISQN